MPIKLSPSKKQSDKPYLSLLDIAKQHRTQTHLETGEISSKISREIIPGTTLSLKNDLSPDPLSFEIQKQLGVGSFGVVYKGINVRDPEKKELAIKIEPYATLRPCIDALKDLERSTHSIEGLVTIYAAGRVEEILYSNTPGLRQKIYLSKKAMSSLHRFLRISPTIIEGEIYLGCLVMEYVNGRSLSSVIEAAREQPKSQNNQLTVNRLRLLQIMIDTSIAIERLHNKGFVHCDLHPRNILVTDSGVKIIDFTCVKHIGEHSGRISQNVYTPVTYASEADQKKNDIGIADYVDVYPLAAALYDALVDQSDFQTKLKKFYDDGGKTIGALPYAVKSYSKLNQISPISLSNVIRNALQKEHPELIQRQDKGSTIQKANELATALTEIFTQEYYAWLSQTDMEIKARQDSENEHIGTLEGEINDLEKDSNRWEDFSVWWDNEIEKEHVRREQWTEDQLQWIQQEYYQEAVRQESTKIRGTMFDVLENQIEISVNNWLDKVKSSEFKRIQQLNETRKTLDGYKITHRRTLDVKLKRVTEIETERWRLWKNNPTRVIGENIIFSYGTVALGFEVAFHPFNRFMRETTGELRKMTWPTRQEAWHLTSIVLISMTFVATMAGLVDLLMNFFWSILLGK